MSPTPDNTLSPARAIAATVAFTLVTIAAIAMYAGGVEIPGHRPAQVPAELVASSLADATRRVEARPDDPDALIDLGWAYAGAGEPSSARSAYERALLLAPEHLGAMTALGILEATQGRDAQAIAWFEQVIAVNPGLTLARFNLGVLAMRAADHATAAVHLEHAVAADPASGDAWYALGQAKEGLGDVAGALEAYSRANQLLPEHEGAAKAIERLSTDGANR